MKNILLICEAYGGGVKTYIDSFATNQDKLKNVNLKFLVSSKRLTDLKSNISEEFIVDDCLSFGKSLIKIVKALKTINRVVKENKIQVIHANSTFSGVLIYLYKKLYNSKINFIYTPHGYYSFKPMGKYKKGLIRHIEKKINNICVKIIHVSKSEEKEAIQSKIIDKQKSIVIMNGIVWPIKYKRINNEKFTIINLARVDDQKNPFAFLEFAKCIIETNPNTQFIWAGNGKHLNNIRIKIKEQGLENHIKFIGHIDCKNSLLSQADLYFSTAYYEGLPFAVIEAMSYGIPLLLSDNVGHRDLIINKMNGLLYKLDDINTVCNFVNTVYYDKEKRADLSKHSYEIFKENFSIEMMLKNTENLYIKI